MKVEHGMTCGFCNEENITVLSIASEEGIRLRCHGCLNHSLNITDAMVQDPVVKFEPRPKDLDGIQTC
jgi:hypothetical protein